MFEVWDSFWRAGAYCLHPRVIAWSLLPLLLAGLLVGGVGVLQWEAGVAQVRGALEQSALLESLLRWLDAIGGARWRSLLAPMVIVALALPLVALLCLLLVAMTVTPAVVRLVVARRFPGLGADAATPWWHGPLWALACALAALAALVLSAPLWFIPPLVLILPPLIWGWLTCRVLSFEVLARHASAGERHHLVRQRRGPLLAMGMVCGFLGLLPSAVWALGPMALALAPVLVLAAVWLYTLVFAFATCWYAHYALAALLRLRESGLVAAAAPRRPPVRTEGNAP